MNKTSQWDNPGRNMGDHMPMETWRDEFEALLQDLVTELDDGETLALGLTGSYARGRPSPYSDVDLKRFTQSAPATPQDRHRILRRRGFLISLATTTFQAVSESLQQPERAIWTVPALRQMRVLLDRDGSLARLIQAAHDFTWEPLQPKADESAADSLAAFAEDVAKVLNSLARGDFLAALYWTDTLVYGLAGTMAVYLGVLIPTEHVFYRSVHEAVGQDTAWTRLHKQALGLPAGATPTSRAQAAAHLYLETSRLLAPILTPDQRNVVEPACEQIQQMKPQA